MGLEIIILIEISQIDKYISFISGNLKKKSTNELIYETETNSQT